jgi:hypothetical protein
MGGVRMFKRVLLGVGRRMVPVPEALFAPLVRRDAGKLARRGGLEPDQRGVQHFAVREIPERRAPISPGTFASELGLTLETRGETTVPAILCTASPYPHTRKPASLRHRPRSWSSSSSTLDTTTGEKGLGDHRLT